MNVKRKTQTSTKSLHHFMAISKLLTNAYVFDDEIKYFGKLPDAPVGAYIYDQRLEGTLQHFEFNENGWLNSPCDYNYPLININNRFYRAMYEKRRANK